MLKLVVGGSLGRMGQRISALAFDDPEIQVIGLLEHPEHPDLGKTVNGLKVGAQTDIFQDADAYIDFTLPHGTMANLPACVQSKTAMVIGTTGFSEQELAEINQAAQSIGIVLSSNMSVGVNILFKLIQVASEKTGAKYKISIDETHHVHKKDAPSGTAKTMAEIAADCSGQPVEDIRSYREGEVIGDHTITFESDEDRIEIFHHAKNRDIFARGSLVAAKFIKDQKPGLYHMRDVLGFTS